MTRIAVAILVGGEGRRMGGAIKPLVEWGGRTILDRQLEVLRPLTDDIALVGNRSAPFAGTGVEVIADEPGARGPLAGLVAALDWAPCGDVFVVAGDMPHLSTMFIETFIAAAAKNPDAAVVAARVAGRIEPLHAIYRKHAAAAWKKLLRRGQRSPSKIIDDALVSVEWVSEQELRQIDASLLGFRNVNEPADLQ